MFGCLTPEVTRFIRWDAPVSFEAYLDRRHAALVTADKPDLSVVIGQISSRECRGVAASEGIAAPIPELDLWLRADAHGRN